MLVGDLLKFDEKYLEHQIAKPLIPLIKEKIEIQMGRISRPRPEADSRRDSEIESKRDPKHRIMEV